MLTPIRAWLPAALLGLGLGVVCLGPALGWGFVLVQDMVFVPSPAFSAFTFGLAGGAARVVPSDAVVTALSQVLPGELVQKVLLLAIFVLGCGGAAQLGGVVAGVFYIWNPYVAERLLMGQWALLLGYAGLPWVVHAVVRGRGLWVAMLPAAVGGFAAMAITGLTALPFIGSYGEAARGCGEAARSLVRGYGDAARAVVRRYGRVVVVIGVFSLPWLVPTVLRPGGLTGDPVGVAAFAARADSPFGVVGSLLSLGGIWNANAVPEGYDSLVGAVARLAVALAGIGGFWMLGRGLPYRRGLVVAAVVGLGIALLGGTGVLRWLVGVWAGFAVLRDSQQFVAPLALLIAVGLGLLATRAAKATRAATGGTGATGVRASGWVVAMGLVPVVVLPTMAWGMAGRLAAVHYPASWTQAREIIAADPAAGDVLVLPFESYRRYQWNGGRALLDPAQRYFATNGRRVVASDAMRVGSLRIRSEDTRAQKVERVLESPSPDLAGAGFRYVLIDQYRGGAPEPYDEWLKAAQPLISGPDLRLYRFADPVARLSPE